MRIISTYHDYYDAVQAMGQDESIVYIRRPVVVHYDSYDAYPFPRIRQYNTWSGRQRLKAPALHQYIVGFCGKIYPVLVLDGSVWNWKGRLQQGSVCFNIDDVDRHVEPGLREAAIAEYRWKKPKRSRHYPRHRYYAYDARREVFEQFFEECKAKQNDFGSTFIDNKCPIFVASCEPYTPWLAERYREFGQIVVNGSCDSPPRGLRELEFYRLMEPFTAFQELSMYFGNIAQPNKTIPEVSDKDLLEAKGFDKMSFRKEPRK